MHLLRSRRFGAIVPFSGRARRSHRSDRGGKRAHADGRARRVSPRGV